MLRELATMRKTLNNFKNPFMVKHEYEARNIHITKDRVVET